MASNIKEKNLIYSFDDYTSMPYPNAKNIDYSGSNSFVNSTTLNNTYQQLVDNDLYIAQQLNAKKNYSIGPTVLDSVNPEQQIENMQNGEKYYPLSNDVKIYRKVEIPLSASIQKHSSFSYGVKRIFKVQQNQALICTPIQTRLANIGKRGVESTIEVTGPNNQQITIDCQCSNSMMNLFFGGTCNSIKGIYKLNINGDGNASFTLAYSLHDDADRQINAIAFRPLDSIMLFSTSNADSSNLYKCIISENGDIILSSISRIYHTQDKTITNILFMDTLGEQHNPDKCIALFISDGSIEYSTIGNALDIFEQLDLGKPYINYQQNVNGIDYYATSQGLQYKNGSQLARIGINAATKNFAVDGNALFVGYSNGDIYKVIGTTQSKISSIDSAGISSLQFVNNVLFAAVSNSLKYANNGTWHDVLRNGNPLSCTTAIEQFYSSGTKQYDNIYVGCKVDDRNYLAVVSVDAPIPYESNILSSGMRDVYPQNGNFSGIDIKLFQHGIVKSQDTIEYHVYSLADDDSSGKIVDLTDSQKRSIAQFSSNSKYHGSIWTDYAQNNIYAGRVGLFINDTLRVYTSLDLSKLQFSNYSLHISFKQAIGNAIDWKIVDSHFLNDTDIIAIVKYRNGTEYLVKLIYLYIDQLELAVKINNTQSDVFQTNIDSSIVCSADNYYVLSSNAQNSYIRSFTTCDAVNDFTPFNTKLALTDLDLTATIDLTRQKIVQGIECTYQLNDLQLTSSQQTFDTYQFRRLDFIATNDSTTPLSAIKSIGYSTSEGLMLIKSSLHAIQSSSGVVDVKFAPNRETSGSAFAMLEINSNNSIDIIVGLDRNVFSGWCISAIIDDPNKITTLGLPHIYRKTVNDVSDAVIYKLSSEAFSYKLYVAAIRQDHVALYLLEDNTNWSLIANTPTHLNQTIKNIKTYYIDDSRQVIFYTIDGVLASYDIALSVETIYSSTTSIKDVIVAFSEVGQQKDAQSMISFSTLPDFDGWQDDSILSSDYEFLRDYTPPSRTFLQRTYTGDEEATIYAITQSSMHEFIYAGTILQETKTIDFKRLGSSILANSFSVHQSPYSAFNDIFDKQIYGNQQNFIVFTLGNDRYNLKTYTGKKCLMCNSTSGGNYFSIPASTPIQKFDRDIADNIWLYKNRDDATTLSAWSKSSHQLVNVGQYVPSSSDEVVYSNNNRGIVAMYVQPSGAGNLSVWTESGSQLNKLAISDKIISMMYKANAPKTPYIAVKQSNASSRIKTFAYEQHYTVNLGFSAFAQVPNNWSIKKIIPIDGSPNAYVAVDQIKNLLYFNYIAQTIEQTQLSFKNIVFSNNIYDGQAYAFAQSSLETLSCFNNINDQNYLPMSKDGSIGKIVAENNFYPTFLSYRNGTYNLYGRYTKDSESERSIEFKFTKVLNNDTMFYKSIAAASGQTYVHGVVQTSNDDYILAANTGVYKYHFNEIGQSEKDCYKVFDGNICDKPQIMYSGSQIIYLVPNNNSILSSTTGFLWKKMVDIGNSMNLSSYMQYNQHILLAGKCTDRDESNGLYYTSYTYYIKDDTPEFTAQSALMLYQQNEDQINNAITSALNDHITNYHNKYDPIGILNSYMSTDFSLSDQAFTTVANVSSISNDYIERILTGDWTTGEIVATASNSTMQANTKQNIELSYIAKQWKSGLLELFVYLPTTYTYYIPHVDGAGYCIASSNDVQVNGHTIAPNISDNATHIQLNILSTYFKLDKVIENTIKGNSLPLKIFKDDTYAEQESTASKVYHSFAQPSIAKEVDLNNCNYDAIPFDYYCFGSDAQAIHIAAWSPTKNNLKKYKTIIYHSAQSTGQSSINTSTIYQRFLENDPQKQIYWDIFSVDNGIFLGWSTDKTATQPDIDNYQEGKTMSYESIDGSIIHLYAVWTFYSFGPSDTAITIQNTSNQTYTIAEITIDPNITFTENQPLKNRLIVKLED